MFSSIRQEIDDVVSPFRGRGTQALLAVIIRVPFQTSSFTNIILSSAIKSRTLSQLLPSNRPKSPVKA